jgi:uncharacterized protein (TIGR00661 family)
MNIVYGVSGEGLGHSFEAIEMIRLLHEHGHTVKILTFGDRACDCLKQFAPKRIAGFSLYVNARGLSFLSIIFKNMCCFSFYLKNWRLLRDELRRFDPDIFITSYEPFTTLASHLLRKPLISIGNQNELLHIEKPRGVSLIEFKLAQWVTRVFTYHASHYIIKTLRKVETPHHNVYFVSPHVQDEIRRLSPTNGDHILVYLTQPNTRLINLFKSMPEKFIVYCNNKVGTEQNITYRASGPGYLLDLSGCRAIIGTTGFALIHDSIYLKKPFFGVPINRQFEQIYNASFLKESGLGEFSLNVTKKDLENFLANLELYRHRLARYQLDYGEYGEKLLMLLHETEMSGARGRTSGISDAAFQAVNDPF